MSLEEQGTNRGLDITALDILGNRADSKLGSEDSKTDMYASFVDNVPDIASFLWGKCIGQTLGGLFLIPYVVVFL